MAQERTIVRHKWAIRAELDNKQVTIFVQDKIPNGGKWKVIFTESDYSDIENEFKKIKAAIDDGKISFTAPQNNENLKVSVQDNYNSYNFSLPQEY